MIVVSLLLQSGREDDIMVLDSGTGIAISLTMLVTISVNIMAVYGVWSERIPWIFPFLVLYMGFILECCFAVTFNFISIEKFQKLNFLPLTFSISLCGFVSLYLFGVVQYWMDPY